MAKKKEPETTSGRDPVERQAVLSTLEDMSLYRLRGLLNRELGIDAKSVKEIELKGKTAMVTAIITKYDEGVDLPGLLVGSRPATGNKEENRMAGKTTSKKTTAKDPFDDDDETPQTNSDDGPSDDESQDEHNVETDDTPPPSRSRKSPAKAPEGEASAVEDKLDQIMDLVTNLNQFVTEDLTGTVDEIRKFVMSVNTMMIDLRTKGLVAIDVLYRMGHMIFKAGTAKPMVDKDGKPVVFKTLYEDAKLRVADQLEEQSNTKE